ncbi:uncharacterized protein [Anas platyrhynchos]|uniref:uncharacterized protein isoform X2 n=1 Tax=Anas platyrhynchos TaxID=8839 RepID=UPI003AF273C7
MTQIFCRKGRAWVEINAEVTDTAGTVCENQPNHLFKHLGPRVIFEASLLHRFRSLPLPRGWLCSERSHAGSRRGRGCSGCSSHTESTTGRTRAQQVTGLRRQLCTTSAVQTWTSGTLEGCVADGRTAVDVCAAAGTPLGFGSPALQRCSCTQTGGEGGSGSGRLGKTRLTSEEEEKGKEPTLALSRAWHSTARTSSPCHCMLDVPGDTGAGFKSSLCYSSVPRDVLDSC